MSIQDGNAPDRVSGHLATGILVDADIVLVPNPPEVLLEPERHLEALIFPVELDDHALIDVTNLWKMTGFALRGKAGRPTAVSGKLLHHSTYGAQIGPVDAEELASTLDSVDGDLWEAFTRLGAIAPEIGTIDPSWLERVTEIERAQRMPKWTEHEFDSYQEMTPGWCIFFCFCQTHGGK